MDVEIHPNAKKHLRKSRCLALGLRLLSAFVASRRTSRRDGLRLDGSQTDEAWSLSRSSLSVGGLSFMPCLQSRRNFGRRLNRLGKGVDDGQDVYGR